MALRRREMDRAKFIEELTRYEEAAQRLFF